MSEGAFHMKWLMSRLMTKPTKWHVCPAKTQISLGIFQIWSESWRKLGSLTTHWVHSKDSDQTGRMDAQSDLSLRWVHSYFVGFVKWRLNIFSSSWEEEAEGAWEIAERERKTAERRTDEIKTRFQNAPDNGGGYHCCGYFLQRYR